MAIAEYISPRAKKISLNSDFHKDIRISPVSKDIALLKDEDAVKESIKNLILTDRGERLMQPYIGGNIRAMLFENLTPGTLKLIEDRVTSTITTYEPRAQLIDVAVSSDPDNGQVFVKIIFYVRQVEQPIELDVILQRNR